MNLIFVKFCQTEINCFVFAEQLNIHEDLPFAIKNILFVFLLNIIFAKTWCFADVKFIKSSLNYLQYCSELVRYIPLRVLQHKHDSSSL